MTAPPAVPDVADARAAASSIRRYSRPSWIVTSPVPSSPDKVDTLRGRFDRSAERTSSSPPLAALMASPGPSPSMEARRAWVGPRWIPTVEHGGGAVTDDASCARGSGGRHDPQAPGNSQLNDHAARDPSRSVHEELVSSRWGDSLERLSGRQGRHSEGRRNVPADTLDFSATELAGLITDSAHVPPVRMAPVRPGAPRSPRCPCRRPHLQPQPRAPGVYASYPPATPPHQLRPSSPPQPPPPRCGSHRWPALSEHRPPSAPQDVRAHVCRRRAPVPALVRLAPPAPEELMTARVTLAQLKVTSLTSMAIETDSS